MNQVEITLTRGAWREIRDKYREHITEMSTWDKSPNADKWLRTGLHQDYAQIVREAEAALEVPPAPGGRVTLAVSPGSAFLLQEDGMLEEVSHA